MEISADCELSGPVAEDLVEPFRLTYPDGAVSTFEASMKRTKNGATIFLKPGTWSHTPGPWRKRLAYWFKCRWWQVTGKWKRGDETE